ncbi:MAG TPA: transcription-repair coupling factor [Syntrophobacteraceae bacterium]|nr:transcription-repair coupling factor [Syntrophobacteraceae bacterium]
MATLVIVETSFWSEELFETEDAKTRIMDSPTVVQGLPESSTPIESFLSQSDSRGILQEIEASGESLSLRGVRPGALAYLLALQLRSGRKPVLLVAATDAEAQKLADSVTLFLGKNRFSPESPLDRQVWVLPSRSGHKAQWLGKMEATARRIEALYALRAGSSPILVAASARSLLERLPPPEILTQNAEYLVKGDRLDPEALCRRLDEKGYYRTPLVEEYGDYGRRGGILDVYAPLYPYPLRLEFFDDEIESVRLFNPANQRSMGTIEEALLLPASEVVLNAEALERAQKAVYHDVQAERLTPAAGNVWLEKFQEGHQLGAYEAILPVFHEKMVTLLDYLEKRCLVVWSDAAGVRERMDKLYWEVLSEGETRETPHEWKIPPSRLFGDPEDLLTRIESFQQLRVNSLSDGPDTKVFDLGTRGHEELKISIKSHPTRERLLEPLARKFQEWQSQGIRPSLFCRHAEQARRLTDLLRSYGVDALFSSLPFGEESFDAPAVKVLVGALEKGFYWPRERLAVVSEEEIFEKRGCRRASKPPLGVFLHSFQDLHANDFVVHVDHGVGIYRELVHLSVRGLESDFLLLEYQDGDRLYVPVDKLQRVQKYMGIEGHEPKVDKLGGKSWETAKKKALESAQRIAAELLQLYAVRRVREGFAFSGPDKYLREFEATFAFEETPDQMRAIGDVLEDMSSRRPMDRLVCGDAGYGKTEVALRAAFRAVMDNKQVAMLVPTTVLAEQHYQTFTERFQGFPIEVAGLSRFKTAAQQKRVLEGLAGGTVDIVIGTHRLLQKDVAFRDLGLVIIDEEHRFGVKHKERLKELRVSVDVLALTATPIPRTLHMSLSGIRDLSTIETPPQDRRAIETYVCAYDEFTIREAIHRELQRRGQVFFVHNHVGSIYQVAARLSQWIPDARIGVAHGQMKERELEKVMMDFIHRKVDVLVCTTIIESGLDIPAANTILINRADKFGLAQIYQLRGRVGRSSEQAFAYLLIPGEHLISRDAQKRLRALLDFSELGAGFKIALNDLQIRGGGTILGSAQSGHISAVGYELYLELLEKTIREFKGEPVEPETVDPEISLPVSAFLPDSYIADTDQRLLAYKRLASLTREAQVDDLATEWRDRYGPFPDSTRNLLLLAKCRLLFKRLGVARIEADEEGFRVQLAPSADSQRFLQVLEQKKCAVSPGTNGRFRVEIWGKHPPHRLARFKRILQEVEENASATKSIQQLRPHLSLGESHED